VTPANIAERLDFAERQLEERSPDLATKLQSCAKTVLEHDTPDVAAAMVILCRADLVQAAERLEERAKQMRGLARMIGEG